jgi:hypothetical protein
MIAVYLGGLSYENQARMTTFWILWGFDGIITLVVLYFFMVGLSDGSVSSFNMGLWMIILLILAGIMGGSLWLKSANHMTLAKVLLLLLAIPGLLYGLFMLFMLIGKPSWN